MVLSEEKCIILSEIQCLIVKLSDSRAANVKASIQLVCLCECTKAKVQGISTTTTNILFKVLFRKTFSKHACAEGGDLLAWQPRNSLERQARKVFFHFHLNFSFCLGCCRNDLLFQKSDFVKIYDSSLKLALYAYISSP